MFQGNKVFIRSYLIRPDGLANKHLGKNCETATNLKCIFNEYVTEYVLL